MVNVRHLVYRIGPQALVNDVDFQVMPGEVLAIVGPNGAGKSTLCSLIAGDLEPSEGEVIMCGRPVHHTDASTLALMRSVLPQHTTLGFPFTSVEVALMGRHPYVRRWRSPTPCDHAMAQDSLLRVKTLHLADRVYPTLSGGEQRRVSLARVLAQDTPVVLLDEPTAALDLGHQELVMALCRRLASEGRAVIAVLHDLNLAGAYADRVAVMFKGRMVAIGKTNDVLCAGVLSEVFEQPVIVIPHPQTGCPVVLTVGREQVNGHGPASPFGAWETVDKR
jgi:iron complex transport system ATP-binding protein